MTTNTIKTHRSSRADVYKVALLATMAGPLLLAIVCPVFAQWQVPSMTAGGESSAGHRLAANSPTANPSATERKGQPQNSHGQFRQDYDIRAYTDSLPDEAKPEQAIVDWILRETGTDAWFSQPAGWLNASRNEVQVYHTPAVQRTVGDIVDRFVHGDASSYVFGIRLVTVQSPNWRSWAYPRLQSVQVQTPGVEAWLVAREDAAVILDELHKRPDFREHSSPNVLIQNARTLQISRMHPLAYVQSVTSRPEILGTTLQTPVMGQVEQGFNLQVSPLLAADERTVDAIIKMETNQVEKLSTVPIYLPTSSAQGGVSIQVPQTSSWRLHERFRWPTDRVLLISCGVVAAPTPQRPTNLGLLGGWNGRASRVEALLFLEAKGKSAGIGNVPSSVATRTDEGRYQGRY